MPAQLTVAATAAVAPAAPAGVAESNGAGNAGHLTPHIDAWTWVAEYDASGGAFVREMDDDGNDAHGMKDVDVSRVFRFTLVPCREGLCQPTVQIDLAAGERVIFTRRRRVRWSPGTGETVPLGTVHLLGVQATVNGTSVKAVQYWYEDNSVLLSSDDQIS